MVDLDLGDPGAGQGSHGGDEPMHVRVQGNGLDDFPPVCLQGAAIVLDGNAGDLPDDPVGHDRWNSPGYQLVLPFVSPAADDVVPFPDLLDKFRDVTRIVLQVSIHGYEDIPPGLVDARRHGGRLPVIFPESYYPEAIILVSQFPRLEKGSILAAVIDEQDFIAYIEWINRSHNGFIQRKNGFLFVEQGDNYG